MVICRADGKVMMCPHTRGVEGLVWQVAASAAIRKLDEPKKVEFCKLAGIDPNVGLPELADQFAEINLAAVRMSVLHPELAALLPADMSKLIPAFGPDPHRYSVQVALARWVLALTYDRSAESAGRFTGRAGSQSGCLIPLALLGAGPTTLGFLGLLEWVMKVR